VSNSKQIHLINPFIDPYGGSERRTLALFSLLSSEARVTLWGEGIPHPSLSHFPIRHIKPFAKQYPIDGILVLVGAYFRAGSWIAHTNARRVILIYNTYAHEQLYDALRHYRELGIELIELVFASRALRNACCLEGIVQTSPIDLGRFAPEHANAARHNARAFTVGRLSRDIDSKHHPSDPGIYRALVQAGCRVRIMGGTCLRGVLGDQPQIELLPAGAEAPEVFLRSLDCFLYRTSDEWHESFGRVVMEAMACGLPVVVHRAGDYSEYVEHGKTGFLFQSDQDAIGTVLLLKQNPGLRATIGDAANAAVKTMMEEVAVAIRTYYLS
jgi:glycosyltransferase involved in cell wall biosynthesis